MELTDHIKIPICDSVTFSQLSYEEQKRVGTLCITSHHLIFSLRDHLTHASEQFEITILHRLIDTVEKNVSSASYECVLRLKDFRIFTLSFVNAEQCNSVAYSIEMLSKFVSGNMLYPFFHQPLFKTEHSSLVHDDLEQTQCVSLSTRSNNMRVCEANLKYEVCSTYPRYCVVPSSVSDENMMTLAQHRLMGRYPFLNYVHTNKCVILTCSQPVSGMRKCLLEQDYLNCFLDIQSDQQGYLFDIEFQSSSQPTADRPHYTRWKRVCKSLSYSSLSDLLHSLRAMVVNCQQAKSIDKWLTHVADCHWLTHVQNTLHLSCLVAQCVDKEKCSVILQESNGRDASLIICSLVQILLDAKYRTIDGFLDLLRSVWVRGGHPFADRHATSIWHTPSASHNESRASHTGASPCFLLFLDCVWQVTRQYACSFQFNTQFLLVLFEHAYASNYGSFLGNCEQDRYAQGVYENTFSLWAHLLECKQQYSNVIYSCSDHDGSVLWPSVAAISMHIWPELFLASCCNLRSQDYIYSRLADLSTKNSTLLEQAKYLQKEIRELLHE